MDSDGSPLDVGQVGIGQVAEGGRRRERRLLGWLGGGGVLMPGRFLHGSALLLHMGNPLLA